jgi:CheY-like chemotaxis protein
MRVLLAENNPVHQEQLTQLLQGMAGAQVAFVASTQQQATDWLDRHRDGWDLTLIDLFLDRDHGYAILRHCRSRAPTQKVAVISDYSADPARARAMEEGADAFFEKAMEMPAMDCVLVGRRRRRRVAPGLHDSSDAAPLKSPGFRPPHASGASSRWGRRYGTDTSGHLDCWTFASRIRNRDRLRRSALHQHRSPTLCHHTHWSGQ